VNTHTGHRTPLAELIDLKVKEAGAPGLMELIAFYREPSPYQMHWEGLSRLIYDLTGRWVNRPSLHTWAHEAGIPDTGRPSDNYTQADRDAYRAKVAAAGITMPTPVEAGLESAPPAGDPVPPTL
jgi:hypothetical protein